MIIINNNRTFKELIYENKAIIITILALFIIRVIALKQLGIMHSLNSDDLSYVTSGIEFKKTGMITMHGVISAQIMPGMPVLIGAISAIFGDGEIFWLALKLLWIIMGCMSAFVAYKCVTLFTPKWCGIITALLFFRPDYIWMDNLILTETPFLLCLLTMVYATLMMGKTGRKRYFWLCLVMYMSALMFKANIGTYPVFAGIYLLIVKYDFKTIIKQGLIIGLALLCFIVPWSIRNYKLYDAFIPLTYGAGNPALLGTYQGIGYPLDENLDYKTNVDDVAKEKFEKYYDENRNVKPYIQKYISLETDGIKAKYRLDEWMKDSPMKVIFSYAVLKPIDMMKSVFYWSEVFSINKIFVVAINYIIWLLFILSVFTAFIMKKNRSQLFFMSLLYLGNIAVYAMTFSFDRYVATLTPFIFISIGIGINLIYQMYKDYRKNIFNQLY